MVFGSKVKHSRAQGTMEYLILLSVVGVIALIAVGTTFVSINPSQMKEKASIEALKVLDISIGDTSFNTDKEQFILKLKNNFSTRINITNIKIGDFNSDFDQNLLAGAAYIFSVDSNVICVDTEVLNDLVITFQSKYGLSHTQIVKSVGFVCDNAEVVPDLRFFSIPSANFVEGTFPIYNGSKNFSSSGNSFSGILILNNALCFGGGSCDAKIFRADTNLIISQGFSE